MSAGVGSNVVQVGSCVRVQGDENESEYVIVDAADADASAGRVSSESPMGRAVLGRVLGEVARVHAPGGVWLVRIVAIRAASAEATG
jgi:transcription elongation factor GreA